MKLVFGTFDSPIPNLFLSSEKRLLAEEPQGRLVRPRHGVADGVEAAPRLHEVVEARVAFVLAV